MEVRAGFWRVIWLALVTADNCNKTIPTQSGEVDIYTEVYALTSSPCVLLLDVTNASNLFVLRTFDSSISVGTDKVVSIRPWCGFSTSPCPNAIIHHTGELSRIQLESSAQFLFESITFTAETMLKSDCHAEYCQHCITDDYRYRSEEGKDVIFPGAVDYASVEVTSRMRCIWLQRLPLFVLASPKVGIAFRNCLIENFRSQLGGFLFFLNGGNATFINTTIRQIDYSYDSGFISGNYAGYPVGLLVFDTVRVEKLNYGRVFSSATTQSAPFIRLNSVIFLLITNSLFTDNLLLPVTGFEGQTRFIEVKNILGFSMKDTIVRRTMGGIALSVNRQGRGEGPDFSVERCTFDGNFASKAPAVLEVSSQSGNYGLIHNCTFSASTSDSESPFLLLSLSGDTSRLDLIYVKFTNNFQAGKAYNSPLVLISSVQELTIAMCEFTNNGGLTNPTNSYFYTAIQSTLIPNTTYANSKTNAFGTCSSLLLLSQILNVRIESTFFGGMTNGCSAFIHISSPQVNAAGAINACQFRNSPGSALYFDLISQPSLFLVNSSDFIRNSNTAILFQESQSRKLVGLSIISSLFQSNGKPQQPAAGAIDITASFLSVSYTKFYANSGMTGGIRFIHQLAASESLSASVTIETCEFQGNVAEKYAADIQISTQKPTNSLLFLSISQCKFTDYASEGIAGAIHISKVSIGKGEITNCLFGNGRVRAGSIVDVSQSAGNLNISTSVFSDIRLTSPSGVISIHTKPAIVSLSQSRFSNISSDFILKLDSSSLSSLSCVYTNNTANIVINSYGKFSDLSSLYTGNICANSILTQTSGLSSLRNATFTYNSGRLAPAIGRVEGPNANFSAIYCTFIGNIGGKRQTALIYAERDAKIELKSSEIVNNTGDVATITGYFLTIPMEIAFTLISNCTSDYIISLFQAKLALNSVIFSGKSYKPLIATISLSGSRADIMDSLLEDMQGSGISANSASDVRMKNTDIRNFRCTSSVLRGINSDFRLEGGIVSGIEVENGYFLEVNAGNSLQITDLVVRNVSVSSALISSEGVATVQVFSTLFTNLSAPVLLLSFPSSLSLSALTFSTVSHSSPDSALVTISHAGNSLFAHSHFINITGGFIGCIRISDSIDFILKNVSFHSCAGSESGGLFAQTAKMNITDCVFETCTGKKGGAIQLLTPPNMDSAEYYIENSTFEGNSAESGGGIYSDYSYPTLHNVSFLSNSASYGPNLASLPSSLSPLSPASSSLTLTSSSTPRSPLYIGVFDYYKQLISIDNSTDVSLSSGNSLLELGGETQKRAFMGICPFENYTVKGKPGADVSLILRSNSIGKRDTIGRRLGTSTEFPATIRLCEIGEILVDGVLCDECASETFSLNVNSTLCLPCLPAAVCKGGLRIYPKAGYWRASNVSAEFFPCPYPQACESAFESENQTGVCSSGYTGNLCQTCLPGYSRSRQDQCMQCPSLVLSVFRLIGFISFTAVVIAWTVYSALKSARQTEDMQSVFLKVVLNYLQLSAMLSSFSMHWPEAFLTAFQYQSFIGETTDQAFSFDCVPDVLQNVPKFYQKVTILTFLPALLFLFISSFWLSIYYVYKRKRSVSTPYSVSLVVTLFLIQPNLMRIFVSSLNCGELLQGEFWLKVEMNLRCWNSEHKRYALGAGLSGLIVWCFGLPIVSLLYLIRVRKRIGTSEVKSMFGFLYVGYRESAYFWEFLISLRKVLLIFVSVFLTRSPLLTQALTVLLVLLASYLSTLLYAPFQYPRLNVLELGSISASALTVICGMYFSTEAISPIAKSVLFIIAFLCNCLFLLCWLLSYTHIFASGLTLKFPRLCAKFGFNESTRSQAKAILAAEEYMGKIEDYAVPGAGKLPEDMKELYLTRMRKRR